MQRLLTTTILVGLLVATAAAFAVTERLKLTKSPLMPGTRVSKVLSPTCSCARSRANIRIKLRRPDLLTVTMLDAQKQPVRTLVDGVEARRGLNFFHWDGRTDGNVLAHDGTFYAEVHLANQHQTIVLPNRIELDTTKPLVKNATLNREAFSPDGDGQADFVRITYELSKPAHVLVYLDGHRILRTLAHQPSGSVSWYGVASGGRLPAGAYTLEVAARDLAGNSTPVADRWRVHVRVRFVQLASHRIVVSAGSRFEIGVSTDATRYSWQLGKRKGVASGPVLRLRASDRRGRYTLTVTERGHSERAAVIVR
ncbi:MAG: hypothetical protein QOD48_403 [Gaiellaceae bacterium]|nr:hypothetical protein [Gaiellaceae bacterium]